MIIDKKLSLYGTEIEEIIDEMIKVSTNSLVQELKEIEVSDTRNNKITNAAVTITVYHTVKNVLLGTFTTIE